MRCGLLPWSAEALADSQGQRHLGASAFTLAQLLRVQSVQSPTRVPRCPP